MLILWSDHDLAEYSGKQCQQDYIWGKDFIFYECMLGNLEIYVSFVNVHTPLVPKQFINNSLLSYWCSRACTCSERMDYSISIIIIPEYSELYRQSKYLKTAMKTES